VATVIASQALISGVFSLTRQAVQLGYAPRMRIRHTSETEIGQIYVPAINWALMVACIGLVVGFRSSTSLAAAYGVAVTLTMVITTLLFYVVARERFGWGLGLAGVACGGFFIVDLAFFGANVFKIPHGGWFPLVIGAIVFTLLTTWRRGRTILGARIRRAEVPLEQFLASAFAHDPPTRVPKTGVFLFSVPDMTPPSLMANLRHNHVLHERTVVVAVVTENVPRLLPVQRSELRDLGHGVHHVVLHYGYMEDPDVPTGLGQGQAAKLGFDPNQATFFLGTESLLISRHPEMAVWRERLFSLMSRNATTASSYFGLPPERTATVGVSVEL
jgi:KUP system potassium uptake protein